MVPASTLTLAESLQSIKASALAIKNNAQAALNVLKSGSVTTDWIFTFLDNARFARDDLNAQAAMAGINAEATQQWPSYAGTLTNDIATIVTNINACISWISSNFPVDAGGFIQAYKLNADGTRTAASFTSAQTVGLQNALTTLIASIG